MQYLKNIRAKCEEKDLDYIKVRQYYRNLKKDLNWPAKIASEYVVDILERPEIHKYFKK